MIIDFTVCNFRSFRGEQTLSLNVESGRDRHPQNYSLVEDGKLGVLRSAVIVGPNASGKSNFLMAMSALRWLVVHSGNLKEGQNLQVYEPFRLSTSSSTSPVKFEVEFIVPSGVRYRYEVSFLEDRLLTERLESFQKRQKALIFQRSEEDTWETVKFGGTYKGGNRKFPFFPNNAYLSKAGNNASSPESIREVYNYFSSIMHVVDAERYLGIKRSPKVFSAVTKLICLADTGIKNITLEDNQNIGQFKFPDNMPEELRNAIIDRNKTSFKFWMRGDDGKDVPFDEEDVSSGTFRLFEVLPIILRSLSTGAPIFVDEIDAHLHNALFWIILQLFHDDEINKRGGQLIFATHNINILDSSMLRRDQIWFASKEGGASRLRGLDEFDKKYVRPDSPFDSFYKDGRLGALPRISYSDIREAILSAISD